MNAITLTSAHKNMLLSMCKALFPEFDKIKLEIEKQYDDSEGFICFIDSSTSEVGDYIHWFELCLTIIPKHLKNKEGNLYFGLGSGISILKMMERGVHPVEYLYNEYLKLLPSPAVCIGCKCNR